MSTQLPDPPAFTGYDVAPSSPAPGLNSLNSGESEPPVMPAYGAGEAVSAPAGYVLIAQSDFDRMMDLIAQLQNEREADRIDHADYERLLEKERAEHLDPLPMFLTAPRLTEPTHCIPRLARGLD